MIDLSQTTVQELRDAAGISVESAHSANPQGESVRYVDVEGVTIHKGILCGLVWSCRSVLRVYYAGSRGSLRYEFVSNPETQAALFAIAGYRPNNPWEDGE